MEQCSEALSAAAIREILANTPRELIEVLGEVLILPGQYLHHYRRDNEEYFDFLAPESLSMAFRQVAIDSGWIPSNVQRWGVLPSGRWMVAFFPPARYPLDLDVVEGEATRGEVPLPAMVFAGRDSTYYVWATRERAFSPGSLLYQAPLSNVYTDGRICYGTNEPPPVAANTIEEAWRLFISSPFNNHIAGHKSVAQPQDVRLLLRTLGSHEQYPLEDLLPCYYGRQLTVDTMVKDVLFAARH
jgi:hypothetical protein